jgi:hypothetical protein
MPAGHLWCCCQTLLNPCVKSWRPSSCAVYGKIWSYLPTTFIDRRWTNARVYRVYELASQTDYPDNPAQKVRPVTEELDERRVRLAGHILRAANDDPLRQVTYQPDKLSPSVSENVELDPTFWHKNRAKPSNIVQKPTAQASLFWCWWPRHGTHGQNKSIS